MWFHSARQIVGSMTYRCAMISSSPKLFRPSPSFLSSLHRICNTKSLSQRYTGSKNSLRKDKLYRYYTTAMQLEVQFFSAQSFSSTSRPINLLVVDFDDTCTAEDTTSMIARTAINATAESSDNPEASRAEGEEKLQWLVRNYINQRNSLLEEILPEPNLDEELEEFDMAWLGDFLDRLSDFDREMNSVVLDSGILSGVKRGMLAKVGEKVPMRPGCLSLIRKAVDAGIPTVVVSVNWSSELVAAALSQEGLTVSVAGGAGGTRAGVEGSPPPLGAVQVYCNDLEYFGDCSTGGMKRRCECATDKGRLFDDVLLGLAAEGQSAPDGVSVYVGDSMTDLPALLSANIGIIMGSNQLVRQVSAAAGVPIRPLPAYPVHVVEQGKEQQRQQDSTDKHPSPSFETFSDTSPPILYEASAWSEIDALLFGPLFRIPHQRTPTPKELSALSSGLNAPAHPPRVLSIAGSDSGGGAGIQADIKACCAAGVYSATAVTALTAQNTTGVLDIVPCTPGFVQSQIRAVLDDIGADVLKTGMIPSVELVEAIADELTSLGFFPPLVVDPVLMATSGDALAENGVSMALVSRLFPLATLVTPNAHEAQLLLGDRGHPLTDVASMKQAAEELHALGPQWVLIKGGHAPITLDADAGDDHDNVGSYVVDILYDGRNHYEMKAPYIDTMNSHGTGCTLATYIAAEMAKGVDIPTAVSNAKKYVWRALERSVELPLGTGQQRPMNHCFRVSDWRQDLADKNLLPSQQQQETEALMSKRIPNSIDLRLYAVTDAPLIAASGSNIRQAVSEAIQGGATVIQLREKDCDGGEFLKRASEALIECRKGGVPLIINDRVDVALAIGADGVHVGQSDLDATVVRKLIGPDGILGVSVKTVEEALHAEAAGADYVGAGAIFSTSTKDSSVIGVHGVKKIVEALDRIPVVAIGGIQKHHAAEVLKDSGAAGIAVVSAIFGARDVKHATSELLLEVESVL